jgi:CheY-like chemotaxis protein
MNDRQRILIVDDEPQIMRVLRRNLTTHGNVLTEPWIGYRFDPGF